MIALVITCIVSFAFGGLTAFVWLRSFRYFNAASATGAASATVTGMLAFGVSLLAIAFIANQAGAYIQADNRAILGSYALGFAAFILLAGSRSRC